MFSRNPVTGVIESYEDDGIYSGLIFSLGDLVGNQKNANDGGPGSGNFGHKGRPGKVGGSASEGSGSPDRKYLVQISKESRNFNEFLDKMPWKTFENLMTEKPSDEDQMDFLRRKYDEFKGSETPKGVKIEKKWEESLPEKDREYVRMKLDRFGNEADIVDSIIVSPASKLTFFGLMGRAKGWDKMAESREFEKLSEEEKENMNFLLDMFPFRDDPGSSIPTSENDMYDKVSEDISDYYAKLKAKALGVEFSDPLSVPKGIKMAKSGNSLTARLKKQTGKITHTPAGDKHREEVRRNLVSGKLLGMNYIGISEERQKALKEAIIKDVDKMDDRTAEIVAKTMEKAKVDWAGSNGTSNFSTMSGTITIFNRNKFGDEETPERISHTFWHEYGHFADEGGKIFDRDENGFIPAKDPLKTTVGCSGVSQLVNGDEYCQAAAKDVRNIFDETGLSEKYEVRPGKKGEYPVQIYRKSDGKFIYLNEDASEDIVKITNAVSEYVRKNMVGEKQAKIDSFMEEHGEPPKTDAFKYFESYTDESGTRLIRNKELYPGARDDYITEEAKRDMEFSKWIQSLGGYSGYTKLVEEKDGLQKELDQWRRKFGGVTDSLDESVKGLFGMCVEYGGHEPTYYQGEIHPNETSANIFSIMCRNDPEEVEFMNKMIPNISDLFIRGWGVR